MDEIENLDFEQILEKLEKITKTMESEKISLDESLKNYELGMNLVKVANTKLNDAQKRITIINKVDGKIEEEELKL